MKAPNDMLNPILAKKGKEKYYDMSLALLPEYASFFLAGNETIGALSSHANFSHIQVMNCIRSTFLASLFYGFHSLVTDLIS